MQIIVKTKQFFSKLNWITYKFVLSYSLLGLYKDYKEIYNKNQKY
jgi:hypothetical protein